MKTAMIITGLIILAICTYFNALATLWFTAGAVWGLINLYFIKQLLFEILIANPKSLLKISLYLLLKIPVLYGIGLYFLMYQNEIPWALLAGFSTVLILCTQKRFWKAISHERKAV